MHRQSKNINATLEVKENKSRSTEEKKEACFPDLSKDQKTCKVTESKITMASEKENFSDGNQAPLQKPTSKYIKDLEKDSYHNCKDVVNYQLTECFFDTLNRDTFGESTLPLSNKENFSKSRPVSLGSESYLTPNRNKAEEKSDCGISEQLRRKPVDFATVTIAEFGITPESFAKQSIEKSPASLKFRRRSTIGVRGSPENNTLIRYLAQQRRNRQKELSTQASPFNYQNAGSLKDKIRAFQTSFKSVQEDEGKIGFSGLSQVADASQEAGYCLFFLLLLLTDAAQNKVPFTKERSQDQWSENLMSVYSGDDSKQNFTDSDKADTKICSTWSSCQDVIVTEPAAAVSKKLICEQQKPVEFLEAVLIKDILETSHDSSPDCVTKEDRSNVTSDLSRKKVSFAEELSLEIFDETKPPITPLQTGNVFLNEHIQSGSRLRSLLKKTPVKQIMDGMKVSDNPVDRRGGESLKVCSTTNICELLQAEETEQRSSEKRKKKKVTFGEDLSPEIFDKTLPANTPLRKGATPVRHPESQSNSPFTGSSLTKEPLSQPNFDCSDECIEPLQELVEDYVAVEDYVENMEETGRSFMRRTRSYTERKYSTISEGIDFSISKTTSTKNTNDAKNPRKNKFQRQKNITASAAKKTPRVKHTSYGKRRRKKKVKKSLYGEREMASKKPLLSPIPEIPEVFSSASSPNTPRQMQDKHKTNAVFPDNSKCRNAYEDVQQKKVVERMRGKDIHAVHTCANSKDLDTVEVSSSNDAVFQTSGGDPKSVSSTDYQFPNIVVPEAKGIFDTSDYIQQDEETACIEEKSNSLIENKKLWGNFLNKAELLTGLEFLEPQDTGVYEDARRMECSPKDCSRGRPPRRGRSSTVYIPYTESYHFETTGNNLPISSFNVEEVLSAPQLKNDSLEEPFRRMSDDSGGKRRVRRSMRLHKDAETEGLAWIQVADEIQMKPPLLASCCKIRRRTISLSVLKESEKVHHREENLIQFSAPAKENNDSVHLADGPCKRCRRKSTCVSTPQETRNWSQTQKRSITELGCRKDRSNQKHHEEVEISLEKQSDI
ncbi:cell division cycle-associated protein 2 isoform X7 [Apteryx rowi]|uniref:cell division cycle-associated protein 2 isoform X7 n=1 Tax=Apteryx rowi TaxID=308060 RepID=UPI000E1C6436|nr:cell division cycle-associated protein 2 isoform X7 [Apteryx rowi]